jgi:AcrR family transcriptional regulator
LFEDRLSGESAAAAIGGGTDHKRRQILDGARRVFLAAGFDGASMGEIAKAAGVSKGTLYSYFESKETLFERLIQDERASLAEALFRLDAEDPDTRAVLRRLGRSFLRMLVRPEHISSVRMVIGVAEKLPRLGQAFYDAGPRQGRQRLAAYLDRQVAAGRLAIPDTASAAQQFLDLCSASVMKQLLFSVTPAPDEEMLDQQVDSALSLFFAVYAPRAAGDRPHS